VKQDATNAWTFRVFLITNFKPLQLAEQVEFTWTPKAGTIEIGAARYWHGAWWVPLHFDKGRSNERFELFVIRGGAAHSFANKPFLVGQAGSDLQHNGLNRLNPENPRLIPISNDRGLFGYDNDSLYLVDDASNSLRVVFHPAKPGLRILDLGDGQVLFWTLHARKAYVVDTARSP
jgi:hypothetical protein